MRFQVICQPVQLCGWCSCQFFSQVEYPMNEAMAAEMHYYQTILQIGSKIRPPFAAHPSKTVVFRYEEWCICPRLSLWISYHVGISEHFMPEPIFEMKKKMTRISES